MATRYYDEALINKLKKWVGDDKIRITSPDETKRLFQYRADENNDKPIELPLITLTKDRTIDILNVNPTNGARYGLQTDNSGEKGGRIRHIPINLKYQIDIFCRYYSEADEYARNFVFQIINFPNISIEIPYYNTHRTANASIQLNGTIEDNSDIPERLIPGEFTRFTIPIFIDNAELFDYKIRDNVNIGQINVQTKLEVEDTFENKEEIEVEENKQGELNGNKN